MSGLSNIFGGDDSTSSSDGSASGGVVSDLGNTIGLDASSNQSNSSTDEDGNSSSSSNANDVGFDSDTDGLLGAVGDAMGSSDATSE